MLATQTEQLLHHLHKGEFDSSDITLLEQTPAQEILAQLRTVYRVQFQERRLGTKWESGVARSCGYDLASLSNGSVFPIWLLVPVFRRCLFVSGEGDAVTGIATATRLTVRPTHKPFKGLALTTGRGFKLDRSPDGWAMKQQEKRTVKLSEELLLKRGWRFDVPWASIPPKTHNELS